LREPAAGDAILPFFGKGKKVKTLSRSATGFPRKTVYAMGRASFHVQVHLSQFSAAIRRCNSAPTAAAIKLFSGRQIVQVFVHAVPARAVRPVMKFSLSQNPDPRHPQ
jgi:hypothetical protein